MKFVVCLFSAGLIVTGCAHHQDADTAARDKKPVKPVAKMIVAPDHAIVGKVKKLNENARFVILNFPIGTVPQAGRMLSVYRGGLKMGEVRITGPQQDDNTVADITAGQAIEGDEVRGN